MSRLCIILSMTLPYVLGTYMPNKWEANQDLVKKQDNDFDFDLVVFTGGTVDLGCMVDEAKEDGFILWKKNGETVENITAKTKVNWKWVMKSYFKLLNVTKELDLMKVTCHYEVKGSYWPLYVILNVFTATGDNFTGRGEAVEDRARSRIAEMRTIVDMNPELAVDNLEKLKETTAVNNVLIGVVIFLLIITIAAAIFFCTRQKVEVSQSE